MGLRFFRRISLLPGVRLNLSKSGPSLSFGPRGASITVGPRGVWGSIGLTGTGLYYRTKLTGRPGPTEPGDGEGEAPSSPQTPAFPFRGPPPAPSVEDSLRAILSGRERGPVDWVALSEPPPEPSDEDGPEYERYLMAVGVARFARRMVAGDRAAWSEVVQAEIYDEDLPFGFSYEWGIEEETDRIVVAVELPPTSVAEEAGLGKMATRDLYEDVCCAVLLRLAYEIFRVIPEAEDVYVSGYREAHDPGTGTATREVLLRLATDRGSMAAIDLDHVDPSTAYEGLGGAKRTKRGALVPIGFEEAQGGSP